MASPSLLWKDRPCHFTWSLKAKALTEYDKSMRAIKRDVEETPKLLHIENLLFQAYLEVSDRQKHWKVSSALEYLDEADTLINQAEERLQNGYKSIALLNRMWIEKRCVNDRKVKDLLIKLDKLHLNDEDLCVIGAVRATALTRLGPHVFDSALELFEAAHRQFPDNTGFLYGAALMSGRKMRFEEKAGALYEELDQSSKALMDKEKEYWKKMMLLNDEYQIARSYLGQNSSRRKDGDKEEARRYLEEAHRDAPRVQAVFLNLIRYYRRNGLVGEAIRLLHKVAAGDSNSLLNSAESHYQLALCYKAENQNMDFYKELKTCLKFNKGHIYAIFDLVKLQPQLNQEEDTQELFEKMLQQSEHLTAENKLDLYHNFATFLERTPTALRYGSRFDIWVQVMDISTSPDFEYQDELRKWQVRNKAQLPKEEATDKLKKHYTSSRLSNSKLKLKLAVLDFQNFHFKQAEKTFNSLCPPTTFEVPFYLAQTYLKWGHEQENTPAKQCFDKARENVRLATQLGLSQTQGRKLLADIALTIAHNQLKTAGVGTEAAQQTQPTLISLDDECIQSYRQAVRCGSLVASLELLRLLKKNHIKISSRSKYLRILAEIDLCCSQRASDCLHGEEKPLSFRQGICSQETDDDCSEVNCRNICRQLPDILRSKDFFRQAWKEHFIMEKQILKERFENYDGDLELDGSEEDSMKNPSTDVVYAASDCCQKLRPLLDHIIVKFEQQELNTDEEKRNQYFPLILDDKGAGTTEEKLQRSLRSLFGIDLSKHYPKLYKHLLGIQPACNPENKFLGQFFTVVNTVKHSGISRTSILNMVKDPVTLARRCTDKVEEICNYFFDCMDKVKGLKDKVNQLVSDIKVGQHDKSDKLVRVLSKNEDFIIRIGSTWQLLKMVALITCGKEQSGSTSWPKGISKIVDGKFGFSKELRRCHLAVEESVTTERSEKGEVVNLSLCRDTCKEADKLLSTMLALFKKESNNGNTAAIEFPFYDEHPGDDSLQLKGVSHWSGKVKKHLHKGLSQKGVHVRLEDKLLGIILQAQPCTSDDNYRFLAMRDFLKQSEGGRISETVGITTRNGVDKTYDVLELTRWCTDNAEKIAKEVHMAKQ